jgi:formylglycine-generating enzyme required for sulfatase activity
MKQGRYADAREAYAAALRHVPGDRDATEGDKQAAGRLVEQEAAEKLERAYAAAMAKGDVAAKAERYAEAQQAYREALGLKPGDRAAREGEEQAGRLLLAQAKKGELADRFSIDVGDGVKMELVRVKAGKFWMGSPADNKVRSEDDEQQHEVEITKDYWLGVTEVTQGQYRKLMGKNPSHFRRDGDGKAEVKDFTQEQLDDFPVENVSWHDAQEFLKKLTARAAELKIPVRCRLPSEAEWEYACRGGHRMVNPTSKDTLPFHFAQPSSSLSSKQANFDASLRRTTKVGSYDANPLGLKDMHGNVWEWCQDWYDKDYYSRSQKRDPPGPPEGSLRVLRGGCWGLTYWSCRCAYRYGHSPGLRYDRLGFRVALVPAP